MRDKGFDEEQATYVIDQEGFDNINVERVERVLGEWGLTEL